MDTFLDSLSCVKFSNTFYVNLLLNFDHWNKFVDLIVTLFARILFFLQVSITRNTSVFLWWFTMLDFLKNNAYIYTYKWNY